MAERRMFSKRILKSARFLKMPPTTRDLYFYLGIDADDDGVVEAYTVMNSIGASEDDLKVLVAKKFVTVLNNDLVTYINDWQENNKIRSDRKVDSIYKDLLLQIIPEVQLQQPKSRSDSKKNDLDNQWTTNGQPMDRIGKVRLGKDSKEEVRNVSTKNENDIDKVLSYLNRKTGKKFRSSSSKNVSLIRSLFKEGYHLEDFKKVIDLKVSDWLEDTKMNEYLRPSTLFNKTHFEEYLNKIPQGHVLNLNHVPSAEELKSKGKWT